MKEEAGVTEPTEKLSVLRKMSEAESIVFTDKVLKAIEAALDMPWTAHDAGLRP